ncbi:MAG: sugar phosphate isomerase/epimerase [Planctomycetaceae bacterium]|jgi:sugar phosphate isomerase/epimerase|nr:sugar phosphate isomerase/epimerase [Planctomycetaceae bacterium]
MNKKMTRRNALMFMTSILGTTALHYPLFAGDREILEKWKVGRHLGIRFQPLEKLELEKVRKAGFQCIELTIDRNAYAQTTEPQRLEWYTALKKQADTLGLELRSLHVPFAGIWDISVQNEEARIKAVQNTIPFFELKKLLGVHFYNIHPSAEPIKDEERSKRLEQCIKSFKELAQAAKTKGVCIVVENLPRTCLGNTSTEIIKIVDTVGEPETVRICFDSNHTLKEKPEEFVTAVGNRIASTHMSDYDGLDEKHWLPYEGIINWNAVVSELIKTGYPGPFAFETSRFKDRNASNDEIFAAWIRIKNSF